ncbi:Hypothetical predicted protein [Mytilus galloprovincialis]|uniref:Zinc finger PHD-type domain-containing protein n=1 Tax=Mytilus galloprovincialis TaxID=29158 RepID=A0A8B6H2N0_MYTGA|nr:Hypothetical predicted protein [Mytilus galloprovincialis]
MSQSANSDSTEHEEEWTCFICNLEANDRFSLDTELLSASCVILIEANGTRWLKCAGCDRRYHMNCVTNIPKNITDDDFPEGVYLCDECGWFASGAYDSDNNSN